MEEVRTGGVCRILPRLWIVMMRDVEYTSAEYGDGWGCKLGEVWGDPV